MAVETFDLVTPYMNTVHNSGSDAALLSRQTHCKRGHEFTPKHEREPRVAVTRRT